MKTKNQSSNPGSLLKKKRKVVKKHSLSAPQEKRVEGSGTFPRYEDIVCGRGCGRHCKAEGNAVFRDLVKSLREEYDEAEKTQKVEISKWVVDQMHMSKRRFLSQDPKTRQWQELSYQRCVEKTSQTFRDFRSSMVIPSTSTSNPMETEKSIKNAVPIKQLLASLKKKTETRKQPGPKPLPLKKAQSKKKTTCLKKGTSAVQVNSKAKGSASCRPVTPTASVPFSSPPPPTASFPIPSPRPFSFPPPVPPLPPIRGVVAMEPSTSSLIDPSDLVDDHLPGNSRVVREISIMQWHRHYQARIVTHINHHNPESNGTATFSQDKENFPIPMPPDLSANHSLVSLRSMESSSSFRPPLENSCPSGQENNSIVPMPPNLTANHSMASLRESESLLFPFGNISSFNQDCPSSPVPPPSFISTHSLMSMRDIESATWNFGLTSDTSMDLSSDKFWNHPSETEI